MERKDNCLFCEREEGGNVNLYLNCVKSCPVSTGDINLSCHVNKCSISKGQPMNGQVI